MKTNRCSTGSIVPRFVFVFTTSLTDKMPCTAFASFGICWRYVASSANVNIIVLKTLVLLSHPEWCKKYLNISQTMSCTSFCATKWGCLVIFVACIIWGLTSGPPSKTKAPSRRSTFLYFAYGSNLLTERIHFQNPSATFKSAAQLDGYKLEFRLPSKVRHSLVNRIVMLWLQVAEVEWLRGHHHRVAGGEHVWLSMGVGHGPLEDPRQPGRCSSRFLWEDKGGGMDKCTLNVPMFNMKWNHLKQVTTVNTNSVLEVFTYLGQEERMLDPDEECLPSGAYKNVIVKGAIEHQLPDKYIEKLRQIKDNGYVGEVDLSVSAWFT